MMDVFSGILSLIFALAMIALFAWFYVRIAHKAGYSGWWVVLMFVPIVNLVMFWVFAFANWPRLGGGGAPARAPQRAPALAAEPVPPSRPAPPPQPAATPRPRPETGGTIVDRPSRPGARREPEILPPAAAAPTWMLSGFDGDGRPVRLTFGGADLDAAEGLVIGRDSSRAHLVLADASVSRVHARLSASGDGVAVEDLDSANGSAVDGRYLESGERAEVPNGGELTFGDARLRLTRG